MAEKVFCKSCGVSMPKKPQTFYKVLDGEVYCLICNHIKRKGLKKSDFPALYH